MKTIKIIKNYYDEDFEIFNTDEINIEEGITVLVGCNGYGKTTFLQMLKQQLQEEKIPFISYSDLHDGRDHAMSKAGLENDFRTMSTLMQSSEGENMIINFGNLLEKLFPFIQTGINKYNYNLSDKTFIEEKENEIETKERWLLVDSIDSGTSIDNMAEIIKVLNRVLKDAKLLGKELYIVISTNAYELARNNTCLDVVNAERIKFKDYEEYREFVLKTSKEKGKRYAKEN